MQVLRVLAVSFLMARDLGQESVVVHVDLLTGTAAKTNPLELLHVLQNWNQQSHQQQQQGEHGMLLALEPVQSAGVRANSHSFLQQYSSFLVCMTGHDCTQLSTSTHIEQNT